MLCLKSRIIIKMRKATEVFCAFHHCLSHQSFTSTLPCKTYAKTWQLGLVNMSDTAFSSHQRRGQQWCNTGTEALKVEDKSLFCSCRSTEEKWCSFRGLVLCLSASVIYLFHFLFVLLDTSKQHTRFWYVGLLKYVPMWVSGVDSHCLCKDSTVSLA